MIKEFNVIKNDKRVMLCHTKTNDGNLCTFMEPLSEKDEKHLDKYANKDIFTGYRNCNGRMIASNNIISYGEIDLNKKSDRAYIKSLNLVPEKGFVAYSSFNYENGTVNTTGIKDRNVVECYDSWNTLKHFQQCHCKINKSPRVIIYTELLLFASRKHG